MNYDKDAIWRATARIVILLTVMPFFHPPLLLLYCWQIVYARTLRLLYKVQVQVWRMIRKHDPQPYNESVLGFLEPRLRMLSRVMSFTIRSSL